eukprot:TRINITY_DN3939_c0_g1_i1.p1 TRINITY_DN3939_c0_g1~~TRINITY_DN3939_c0_g1_i1.p1  ORF type:complete len:152 (-),score=12.46 TRINITY_DN3939_c0_g1_i1:73-528(-)
MSTALTPEEIEKCREAFDRFDADGSGSIDMIELRSTLQALGQNPTEEDLFQMISEVDDNGSQTIEFSEFLKVIESQKRKYSAHAGDDQDTIDAFVALGGNPDKSGSIGLDRLRRTCKDFGLTIDIEQLIHELDSNENGTIDFQEFAQLWRE